MNGSTLQQIHALFQALPEPWNTRNVLSMDLQVLKNFDDVSLIFDRHTALLFVLFHRQNKSVNILDSEMVGKMSQILEEIEASAVAQLRPRAAVLFSLKPTNFIAGADVNMIYKIIDEEEARQLSIQGHRLLLRMEKLAEQHSMPIVAAINGSCLGGGLEVALACSHRLVSRSKSTQLGLPEVKLGLLPGCGGTVRLPRMIGLRPALELITSGSSVNSDKALKIGIADHLVDYNNLNEFFLDSVKYALSLASMAPHQRRGKYDHSSAALSWGDVLLQNNPLGRYVISSMTKSSIEKLTHGHYPAPLYILEQVLAAWCCSSLEQACDAESRAFAKLAVSQEAKSLISLFLKMEDSKKLEDNVPNVSRVVMPKRISVIGAGLMGTGIAQFAAYHGFTVYLKDISQVALDIAMDHIRLMFQELVDRKKLSDKERQEALGRVTTGTQYTPVAQADVIIEAAIEDLDTKQRILAECKQVNPMAIYATNTSSIPLSQIALGIKHKENIVGMHFFAPVHRMPLVEIVHMPATSSSAIATIYKLALELGKTPVVVSDGPGFLTTRLFAAYTLEASQIVLEQNIDFDKLDSMFVREGLFPMGPMRVSDESGLDVAAHVIPVLTSTLGVPVDSPVGHALRTLIATGATGKKSGKGFYLYKDGKKSGMNPDAVRILSSLRPADAQPLQNEREALDRCILLLINEAAKCIQEGIASSAADVDVSMILGFGFAPFTGGLLHYADTLGIRNVVQKLESFSRRFGDRFTPALLLVRMSEQGKLFFPDHPRSKSTANQSNAALQQPKSKM